jgi:SAM-dependent methyltransferase
MVLNAGPTGYDRLAWFYNRYWGAHYHSLAIAILERMLLRGLPTAAHILDLCCGTGHLTQALAIRGYRVTGIDASLEMLRYARVNVPAADFIVADARAFSFPVEFDAVISTFESLNHVLSLEELVIVFRNVYATLRREGTFVFDLNTEEAYQSQWQKSSAVVEEDNVCIVRGGYNPAERIGQTDITMFRLEGKWQRDDLTLFQRCYSLEEIRSALEEVGFGKIAAYDAAKDLGMSGDLGIGRSFFLALKEEPTS